MSSKPLDTNVVVIEGIHDLYEVLATAWIKQNKTPLAVPQWDFQSKENKRHMQLGMMGVKHCWWKAYMTQVEMFTDEVLS